MQDAGQQQLLGSGQLRRGLRRAAFQPTLRRALQPALRRPFGQGSQEGGQAEIMQDIQIQAEDRRWPRQVWTTVRNILIT